MLFLILPVGSGTLAESGVPRLKVEICCLSGQCKCGSTNHCQMPAKGNMAACRCAPGASPFLAAGPQPRSILQAVPHRGYLAPPIRTLLAADIFHPPKFLAPA